MTFHSRLIGAALAAAIVAAPAYASDKNEVPPTAREQRANKPGDGLYVVDSGIQLTLARAVGKDKKGFSKDLGGRPDRLQFWVWGKAGSEDKIVVTWRSGKKVLGTTECPVPDINDTFDSYSRNYADQGEVTCQVDRDETKIVYAKPGTYQADISLKSTETQALTKLRTIAFKVANHSDTGKRTRWYVDQDFRLAENFAYWDSTGLNVRSWTKQASDSWYPGVGKLKCAVDGQPLGKDGNVNLGDAFSFRDMKNRGVKWAQLVGTIYEKRDSGSYKPGKYECKMLVDGKVMRIARFDLDADLRIVPSERQTPGTKGALSSRSTYLPDVELPKGIDAAYDQKAVKNLAFFGPAN